MTPADRAIALEEFRRFAESRRSVRRYAGSPVPDSLLEAVLSAALSAPSPHNRQPVRLALIERAETREKLVAAMGQRLRSDRTKDGDSPSVIERDIVGSRERLLRAPVLLLVALSMNEMDRYPDSGRQQAEFLMAAQAAAMAGQNIALAAHAAGVASCWMCAPVFCPELVAEVIGLPEDWRPQGLMTMGYAQGPARSRPRKALEEILQRF